MATLTAPTLIPATDCIGNSLTTINNNFNTLFQDIQNVQSNLLFPASLTTNGYQQLPSGLYMQWGRQVFTNNGKEGLYGPYTFPIAFPNACLNLSLTTWSGEQTSNLGWDNWPTIPTSNPPSTTQFYVWSNWAGSTTSNNQYGFQWFAVGY